MRGNPGRFDRDLRQYRELCLSYLENYEAVLIATKTNYVQDVYLSGLYMYIVHSSSVCKVARATSGT